MSEYKPLQELFPLEEGTVLGTAGFENVTWDGKNFTCKSGHIRANLFDFEWRIVSTPPEKIEFETVVVTIYPGQCVYLPYGIFDKGTPVRVTVEEKR